MTTERFGHVSFLSDFGRRDVFVGVVHGVIARLAPHARVIDLTHEVAPQDVRAGAALLARAVPYLPVAVHLAVVDPGVGTERRGIAVETSRGDVLVGPDNGLLLPAARALGGSVAVRALESPAHRLPEVSATFHGRDVFAPAAAALAGGATVTDLGAAVADAVDLVLPRATAEAGRLVTEVLLVDRFGNAQLTATPDDARQVGLAADGAVRLDAGSTERVLPWVETFGALGADAAGILVDSDGCLAVVVNGGSAARRLELEPGQRVTLGPASAGQGGG